MRARYPVIAYWFEPGERATANGTYSMGTYLGSALSTLSLVLARDGAARPVSLDARRLDRLPSTRVEDVQLRHRPWWSAGA